MLRGTMRWQRPGGASGRPVSKLSIIVATYGMQREAPRTIRSLLPALQRCVDDVDQEIVVVGVGPATFSRHSHRIAGPTDTRKPRPADVTPEREAAYASARTPPDRTA